MLTFKTSAVLAGCGIDAEYVDRFTRWIRDGSEPSPMIFSAREIDHCAALTGDPGVLCASYCCKEAVYKALGQPFDGPECELFWMPDAERCPIELSERLRTGFRLNGGCAYVKLHPSGVVRVLAYLFGDGARPDRQ